MSGEAYVFGCIWPQSGHGCYADPNGRGVYPTPGPWGNVDQKLTPKDDRTQGAGALHWKDGWTALAFHDYIGDSRPGSNTVLLVADTLSFDAVVELAARRWPSLNRRLIGVHMVDRPKSWDEEAS